MDVFVVGSDVMLTMADGIIMACQSTALETMTVVKANKEDAV